MHCKTSKHNNNREPELVRSRCLDQLPNNRPFTRHQPHTEQRTRHKNSEDNTQNTAQQPPETTATHKGSQQPIDTLTTPRSLVSREPILHRTEIEAQTRRDRSSLTEIDGETHGEGLRRKAADIRVRVTIEGGRRCVLCVSYTHKDPDPASRGAAENKIARETINTIQNSNTIRTIHRVFSLITLLATRAWLQPKLQERRLFTVGGGRFVNQSHSQNPLPMLSTCVTLNGSGIHLAVGPQPLRLRNHNSGLAHRIMVRASSNSPHDPLGITDSACKNQLVVVSVQYGPFNTYIPIRSTTIGKSRVAKDPIAMRTSWRSNSDIASVTSIGYPHMSASGESSTTIHPLLHSSGSHPIPPPNDPMTNQYNQDLGLIHSTNGNHLESPNEGSSIDHQVTIYLHAQNITMFPTNETWYFASQILVSSSGGLILILTAQSTRN
ncbi:hypothetical protein F511_10510 [Dorcoceras hygrometricum]|uniref:Uncharacterized protein n=1 Tax=Dorcoceras hygrometricum TaxID=472368 RepID=A0A2Z7ACX9_9LAMI|nr:hypothetical protein F511_10510 [Dorcoceras hygrometricum]